ncbi:WD repeat/BOP1NT protein [Schizosaccharomyces cryophilus OY26]|uniref:Ribosome biogenesis protein ERB1 n=1 Tax=Schizosaccharomyces cryophilus (strain OY26 / ATCC MYA-4695 / CBS 11777 / NBRC 106824 / NRRL Y48691) TaxID=653667 RepID=S9W1K6_SCHCR|nr:WD repeat/BOP1NT protein [Schizosaccharomyces cryophilus OY26]EPY53888.1 WD repeat/BOP1NT protein [Schizosaccharomyces cryophilus OY26]
MQTGLQKRKSRSKQLAKDTNEKQSSKNFAEDVSTKTNGGENKKSSQPTVSAENQDSEEEEEIPTLNAEIDDENGNEQESLSDFSTPELSEDDYENPEEDEEELDREIDAGYSSDSSTEDAPVGLYPSPYDDNLYIDYDIDGKKITRPATPAALDSLIASIDKDKGWTGIVDPTTGQPVNLTTEELGLLKRLAQSQVPDEDFDPYPDYDDFFTKDVQLTPVSSAPEPKRRFAPSKNEEKRILQLAYAIRKGHIMTPAQRAEQEKERKSEFADRDLWADDEEATVSKHLDYAPAPKLPPPSHEESYNPPEEYLKKDSKKYPSLRLVPAYTNLIKERFERCLDLYLAPRVRRSKLNIDPESLLPKLPSPSELRPFPTRCTNVYIGHKGRVRCISAHKDGIWLASGGDDGVLRVWEILTGRCVWKCALDGFGNVQNAESDTEDTEKTNKSSIIQCLAWGPLSEVPVLAVGVDETLYFITPPLFSAEQMENSKEHFTSNPYQESSAVWRRGPKKSLNLNGAIVHATVSTSYSIKSLSWHRRGDYIATCSPTASGRAVLIHQLSRGASQSPFSKSRGSVQSVAFHPTQPYLLVATQRYVRIYNLVKQELVKTLLAGVKWISSISVHPSGDHVIIGSYDKRLCWFDLDLSSKPYKTLRYHTRALRDVSYHPTLPLFCSASDDGDVQVFHGRVYNDLLASPLIVPLKILRNHKVVDNVGVLSSSWHPREAWLFTSGASGEIRMWT